jgi:hypothetical protein
MNALALLLIFATSAQAGSPLRIDSVEPLANQPQATDPAVIWYDDFNGPAKPYTETSGTTDDHAGYGGSGGAMVCLYPKGEQGVGNRKVMFGDGQGNRLVRKGEMFDDVYWRVYVKHQRGWTGGGEAKLSRITSLVSANWAQAMIGHVWTGGPNELTLILDPATGVRDGQVVTTKYNDFSHLRWLGSRPSQLKMSSPEEGGWWTCVEARVRLNTPGSSDGIFQLWIDDRLEAERTGLDWRGTYKDHGLNALYLEAYWNKGSPVTQTRWLDNFVIATHRIGPVVVPRKPVLILGGPDPEPSSADWQAEIAGRDGAVVWQSKPVKAGTDRLRVDPKSGAFVGALAGQDLLANDTVYYARVRRAGATDADWSPWHQSFLTGAE